MSGETATPTGPNQIDLSWNQGTDDITAPAMLIYEICQASATGGCSVFIPAYTTTAGATTFAVTGLSPLTQYFFVIRAKDQAGNTGGPSLEISATTLTSGTVNGPTFLPVAGSYPAQQTVTLSSSTTGAIICYSTSGTPTCDAVTMSCTAGTLYTKPIPVTINTTINAEACLSGNTNSPVVNAPYLIDTANPSGVFGTAAVAASPTQIDLSWTNSADDSTPTANIVYEVCNGGTSSGLCPAAAYPVSLTTAAGVLTASFTGLNPLTKYYFRVRASDQFNKKGPPSDEFSATTLPSGTVETPTFLAAAGSYASSQTVAISTTTTAGTGICYTTDNVTDPVCNTTTGCVTGTSIASGASVSVTASKTIRARGCRTGWTPSPVAQAVYVIDTVPPGEVTGLSAASGNGSVTLSWTNPGDADFNHVIITPSVGTPVTVTPGTPGNPQSSPVTSTNGDRISFSVQTVDALGNTSTGVTIFGHASANLPGALQTFTAVTNSYNMRYVPPKSFYSDNTDTPTTAVSRGFWIGETEVTHELWNEVVAWGSANGYTFANAGQQGGLSATCGSPVIQAGQPVVCINTRDMIVWANAYTDYYNNKKGTSFTKVYTGITTSANTSADSCVEDTAATGFRLLGLSEWLLAARTIGDSNGDGDILDSGEYYPGHFASGALDVADADRATVSYPATNPVAWFGGTGAFPNGNTISSQPAGLKNPNALNLYDMSGNVEEMLFTVTGGGRYRVGGSYTSTLSAGSLLMVGYVSGYNFDAFNGSVGFRVGKNE